MSVRLRIKDISAEQNIKNDFDEIRFDKFPSTLRNVNLPVEREYFLGMNFRHL